MKEPHVIDEEFGSGLSYTSFRYDDFQSNAKYLKPGGTITFKIKVTNTGSRAGKESVLLFVRDIYASIAPDYKRLRRFEKVLLRPGQSKEVVFKIAPKDLAFIGEDGKPVTESGEFEALIVKKKLNFIIEQAKPYLQETLISTVCSC